MFGQEKGLSIRRTAMDDGGIGRLVDTRCLQSQITSPRSGILLTVLTSSLHACIYPQVAPLPSYYCVAKGNTQGVCAMEHVQAASPVT